MCPEQSVSYVSSSSKAPDGAFFYAMVKGGFVTEGLVESLLGLLKINSHRVGVIFIGTGGELGSNPPFTTKQEKGSLARIPFFRSLTSPRGRQ